MSDDELVSRSTALGLGFLAFAMACAPEPQPASSAESPQGGSRAGPAQADGQVQPVEPASNTTDDAEFGLVDPDGPPPPTPAGALGRVAVDGPLPPEVVGRILGQFNGRLLKCTSERRSIRFLISPDGAVTRDTLAVEPADPCVEKVMLEVTFPSVLRVVHVVFEYEP
jgi:hypothetical protein